ncbi:MAG TPA: hypothetical protein VED01_04280 [Burkholderiales bacterium]|nr:hypothetical protein [Burkholderiales bacterium]
MARALVFVWTAVLIIFIVSSAASAAPPSSAVVVQDHTALRAAPRDSAQQQAVLWAGDVVEVRAERMDYLQVWDHRRERGGFVRASHVRRTSLTPAEAPELLSVVRFVRDTTGAEALGIGLVAAYIQAAPADVLNGIAGVEALDALGTMADRLARRASSSNLSKPAQERLSAHLEVAARHGVKFTTLEREGRMQVCYDGDAFRRVLAMQSNAEQRARAVLALTRQECVDPDSSPLDRARLDEWRAEVLDRVDAAALPTYLRNRVHMRRAGVWSSIAYARTRKGETAGAAATRPLTELAAVNRAELTDEDAAAYNEAAMRVGAARWAALPNVAQPGRRIGVATAAGQPGETCLMLVDERRDASNPLAKRCTYGIVWLNSASLNREGNTLAISVQQTESWLELWIFRRTSEGWTLSVLPPAATTPALGYAEFAGWVPGGRQMLVAREFRSEGRYRLSFEVMRVDTLTAERQAGDASILGAFQRWRDPSWKRQTVSLR